jgi:MATE family multidrug resistance protein
MHAFWKEIRLTLILAVPMILGLLGNMSLHLIDAAMVGRVGVVQLAGIAFGGNVVSIFLIMGFGLSHAVPVLVARAYGARQLKQCADVLKHGVVITAVYAIFVGFLFQWRLDLLYLFGQPEEVVRESKGYAAFLAWSLLPTLIYQCFRGYSEALNRPWPPFVILAIAFFLNIFLNWVFIFGNLGAHAMGGAGAGLATLLARAAMMVGMIWLMLQSRRYDVTSAVFRFLTCTWTLFRQCLNLGIPTAFQILFEAGMFTLAGIMMGWLGANALAAHQIAMNLAAMSFMVPLGMSFAVAIRIGHAAGGDDWPAIRRTGFSAFIFCVAFMSLCALMFLSVRHEVPWFFLDRDAVEAPEVVALTASFLAIAALFQMFDGLQVVCMGALRGIADVKMPTVIVFFGYWGIAIPMCYYLGFIREIGGLGIWYGLLIGLALGSIALLTRFCVMVSRGGKPSG